jgi:sugar phosphate isomerase/epimerase
MKIGVQTFTIRKQQKKDMEKAYLPLIRMGIQEFEVARIKFNRANACKLKELIDKYGIRVVSVQVKPKQVYGDVDGIVEFCNITGCKNVVISMLPFSCILGREEQFYKFLETLDTQYDIYKARGIELAYHHHNWEYVTLSNGRMRMDELLTKTEKIRFVHDTYWTTKCGISPVHQIQRFGNRLLGIHLRDLTLYKKGLKVLSKDAAIGEGIVDFNGVFSEAKHTGCEYCVIEQKTKQPYEKIQISYQNCIKSGMDKEE